MRQFGLVVEPFVLPVFNSGHDFSFSDSVAFQLVGDDDTRNIGHPFQKLVEETLGGFPIASELYQDIERIAILIHCTPEVVVFPLMVSASSSRCHSSPRWGCRRRRVLA